jgi:hypothetical protein
LFAGAVAGMEKGWSRNLDKLADENLRVGGSIPPLCTSLFKTLEHFG